MKYNYLMCVALFMSQTAFGMNALKEKQKNIAAESASNAGAKKQAEKSPEEAFFDDPTNRQLIIDRIRLGEGIACAVYDLKLKDYLALLEKLLQNVQVLQPKLEELGMDHNNLDDLEGYQAIYQPEGLEVIAKAWLSEWSKSGPSAPAPQAGEIIPKGWLALLPPPATMQKNSLKDNILNAIKIIKKKKAEYLPELKAKYAEVFGKDAALKNKLFDCVLGWIAIDDPNAADMMQKALRDPAFAARMRTKGMDAPAVIEQSAKGNIEDCPRQYANDQLDALVYLAENAKKLTGESLTPDDIAQIKKAAEHEPNSQHE